MDRLSFNSNSEFYCGLDIAYEFVGTYIKERIGDADIKGVRILVVSDRNVGGYFYSGFEKQFLDLGVRPELTIVDSGNMYKNLDAVAEVVRSFVDFGFASGDWVIAFGGGGVLDITGFACSVYNSNLNLICVPTTMNAMVEGSVNESCLVNAGSHKNVLSSPVSIKAVFADPFFLRTVPDKVRSNGYAAVIRYSVLADPGLMLRINEEEELRIFLEDVYKARDKVEKLNPVLLTLGNEIADAIEGYFRFMNYSEGEALALSIYAAVPRSMREKLNEIYEKLGLPYSLTGVSGKMIMKNLSENLKRIHKDDISIVDLETGGKSWIVRNVPLSEALDILEKRIGVICAD